MTDVREALLEAHVRYELARLSAGLSEQIAGFTGQLFRWFDEIKLDDVASVAQVMGTIERCVIEMRLSGGITELVGEMSQVVFRSQNSAETRLDEVLDEVHYERFAQKVTALGGLGRELSAMVARSEAFRLVTARLVSRSLGDLLPGGATANKLTDKLLPAFERWVARALTRYLGRQGEDSERRIERHLMEALDPEYVRSVADEIWASVSSQPLTDAFLLITEQDLEDFVALGYEFWQRYRKTSYFRRISEELVVHFFGKYGQQSLLALIADMGVTQELASHELTTFLGPLIAEAARGGFLEKQIRARLEPFYRSQAIAAVLLDT